MLFFVAIHFPRKPEIPELAKDVIQARVIDGVHRADYGSHLLEQSAVLLIEAECVFFMLIAGLCDGAL